MDPEVAEDTNDEDVEQDEAVVKPRQLPHDLPKTLDDRRPVQVDTGIEVYDAWQGMRSARITIVFLLSVRYRASNISFHPSCSLEFT